MFPFSSFFIHYYGSDIMIINKIDNNYIIKLLNTKINIYDPNELEEITKKIIIKISKSYKLNNCINLEFYLNDKYGTIIKLKDYKSPFIVNNDKTVKITIHTEAPFLYQIDYFDINKNNIPKKNIYYYKNKFYLEINNNIENKDYLKLIELSEVIYQDTEGIINKGIKI